MTPASIPPSLRAWLDRGPRARERAALEAVHALATTPLISVVMPAYETPPRYLREAIESLRAQHYPAWELCVIDDGSRNPEVRRTIAAQAARDERIKPLYPGRNAGISAASNAALAVATGEYVAFLDHDDTLTDDALLRVAQVLSDDPATDIVYSDSDKLTLHGQRADPFLKPDWSPVYALGAMYVGHLLVVRRALVERAGGFDSGFDTIQDFELMMRLCELTDRIHHIPRILYHWRAIPGSIAAGAEEKQGVPELQARAVSEHLRRIGARAKAVPHPRIPHRAIVVPNGPGELEARVSIVIDWEGEPQPLSRLLASIERLASPLHLETIVVAPAGTIAPPALDANVRLIEDAEPRAGRARRANLGAREARGDELLFVADTVELVAQDSLEQLLVHRRLPGVGAVGPLLVRPDGRTHAAGFAVGLRAPVLPMLSGVDADDDGYYGALVCARDVSALGAECLLVEAAAFDAAGGFNEWYAAEYHDFDLCQRLLEAGSRVVCTPRPRVVTHELRQRRRERADVIDRALFVDTWYARLERGDPYYNPNFSREDANYAIR